MRQKTPLAEAIDAINSLAMDDKTIKQCLFILTELLPKEKEVITDTYDDGYVNGMQNRKPSSLDYFNETFTQKQIL